jgi:hypothetical protein
VPHYESTDWAFQGEFAPQSKADVKFSGHLRILIVAMFLIDSVIKLTSSRFQEARSHNSFQDGYITLPQSTGQDALEKYILSARTCELASSPGLVVWIDMNFIQ